MNANLKGLGGIKGLALRHGEKVLIAGAGLVAAWFVYSSLQLPRLKEEFQADKLQGKISQTNTAITTSAWPEEDSEAAADIRKYKPIAKQAAAPLDHKQYPGPMLDPPVVTATLLRGDPVVRPAVGVRAQGQSGLLAFRDAKTMEEQARRQQLEEEERQREQERLTAEQQAENAEGPGGRAGRRGAGPEDVANEVFDPEHPERRLIEGMGTPAGVPLQGGERLERVSWATVVAKVPIREQLDIFQTVFRNARGYDVARDFPQYVGYQVQRREIVAGKPTDWKVVNVYDGQKKRAGNNVNIDTVNELNRLATAEWAGPSLEPVDPRWTDMLLTLPLPPLVGRNFGEDATHPDIPLAINAPPPEEPAVPAEGPAAAPAATDDEGAFSAGGVGQQRPAGGEFAPMRPMGPGPGGEFGMRPGGMGMRGMMFPGGGPEGGEFGRGGMVPGGGQMSAGGISTGQRTELPRGVDYLLLRFFDYTVEPGKEYQYRVMLYVADPNNSIPLQSGILESAVIDRRLKEIQAAKLAKRQAPWSRPAEKWSEPSPVVGIPSGGVAHVAEAHLPSNKTANDEPSITMLAEAFDIEPADGSAIHVAQEMELHRGSVINYRGKVKYTGENDRWIDNKDEFALHTGLTVLDMDGGKELAKKMTVPSRVLLMDGAGQLVVRDEQGDLPNVKYLRSVFTDKPRRTNQLPGGEFGPGGPAPRGGPGRER